ncbi:MAG: hypothetical protein HYV63_03150 [Candidatus Schekmanbacteria bacterium]|nr:hypothetical protein [Candidatus Schekmanbacteria bacterium]
MKRKAALLTIAAMILAAVVSMVAVASAATHSSIAFDGTGMAFTFIAISNTGTASENVQITFFNEAGTQLASSVSAVAPGAMWRLATEAGAQYHNAVTGTAGYGDASGYGYGRYDVDGLTSGNETGLLIFSTVYFLSSSAGFNQTLQ